MPAAMNRQDLETAVKQYVEEGVTTLRGVIEPAWVQAMRNEILGVIEEVSGRACIAGGGSEDFVRRSTEILWDAISEEPAKRNLLYTYAQRVPMLYQLANAEPLRQFTGGISIQKPSVREAKVQIFLPWEKLFLQDCHQDINSLDSSNSVTFWIPLHPLTEKTAVRYWVGSHKEGPVRHEEIMDEAEAIYLERVPQHIRDKYPVVSTAAAKDGDVIAINRLVFHQSPSFEDQLYARWSVVVRYDDIAGNGLYLDKPRYADFAPNSAEKMKPKLDKIRARLSQKPQVDWPDKLRRAGAV